MNSDTELMRKAFEKEYTLPMGVKWDENSGAYGLPAKPGSDEFARNWVAWQRSWAAKAASMQEENAKLSAILKTIDIVDVGLAEKVVELQAEVEALKYGQEWISVYEFKKEPNEGWCWISYKGRVVSAYHDHEGKFKFSDYSINCFMTECIGWVMPWYQPEPPKD